MRNQLNTRALQTLFAMLSMLILLVLLMIGGGDKRVFLLWAVVVGIMGLIFAALSQTNVAREDEVDVPQPSAKQVATTALWNVGNRSHAHGLQLLDIGLLSYDGGTQPKVIRTETVPAYASRLRPFILINVANAQKAHFTIKFTLVDERGTVRFVVAERYQFQHGHNFFTPHNWLPMGDDEPGGNWSLHVSIANQPLARHNFTLAPDTGAYFRAYLRPDGEIDEWLSKSATSAPTETLSLDDLLDDRGNHAHGSRTR